MGTVLERSNALLRAVAVSKSNEDEKYYYINNLYNKIRPGAVFSALRLSLTVYDIAALLQGRGRKRHEKHFQDFMDKVRQLSQCRIGRIAR
jgi:hypothetical protein